MFKLTYTEVNEDIEVLEDFADLPKPSGIAAKLPIKAVTQGRSTEGYQVDEFIILPNIWTNRVPLFNIIYQNFLCLDCTHQVTFLGKDIYFYIWFCK